jgi:hypothetical protein
VIPDALTRALAAATRVVALTGAGVSAESGVPTFRDAQTGLWSRYRPEDLATPEAFERDPALVWNWCPDFSPGRSRTEMKALNSNEIIEIDFYTVCFTPRSFGAGTPRALLGTFLPASHSYGYARRSRNAPRTPQDAPSSESLMRSPG